MFDEQPTSVNDVASPGTTAAAPFSRPIVVTDQPTQADPMMAERPADLSVSTPTAPLADFAQRAAAAAAETPDHFHSLKNDKPFAYDVKHHRLSTLGVIITIVLMAGAAFLGYYVTKVYLLK